MKSVRFLCLNDSEINKFGHRHFIHRKQMEDEAIRQGWNVVCPDATEERPEQIADLDIVYMWGPWEFTKGRLSAKECIVIARGLQDGNVLSLINAQSKIRHVFYAGKYYMEHEGCGNYPRSWLPPSPPQRYMTKTDPEKFDIVVFGGGYGWSFRYAVVNTYLRHTDLTIGIRGPYWEQFVDFNNYPIRLTRKPDWIPLEELGLWLNQGRITTYMNPRLFGRGISNAAMFELVLASDTLCLCEQSPEFKNIYTFDPPVLPHHDDPNFEKKVIDVTNYYLNHPDEAYDIAKQMRSDLGRFTMEKAVKQIADVINSF